jgi:CBS domain-containing protein
MLQTSDEPQGIVTKRDARGVDWSRAPLSLLVAHLEEVETAQRQRLASVHHRAVPEGSSATAPNRTFGSLFTCLEREVGAHGETSARLRALTAAVDRGECDPKSAPIGNVVRCSQAEHESILGLFDFAFFATAGFTSQGDAEERATLQALARWDRDERAHLRLEAEVFVPLALALGASAEEVVLTVHHLELLSPGGRSRNDMVYCPADRRSVDLDWCRPCPVMHRIDGDSVRCAPDVDTSETGEGHGPAAEQAPVGEVLGATQVSAIPGVPADRISEALARLPDGAAVVVDDGHHVLGLFEAEDASRSSSDRGNGELSPGGVLESASLADAMVLMAQMHRRHLPVVRDDEKAVGVLSETDALGWVAAHRRRIVDGCCGWPSAADGSRVAG